MRGACVLALLALSCLSLSLDPARLLVATGE
jgi:hypothetical protein